jgi:hypothetical protein
MIINKNIQNFMCTTSCLDSWGIEKTYLGACLWWEREKKNVWEKKCGKVCVREREMWERTDRETYHNSDITVKIVLKPGSV